MNVTAPSFFLLHPGHGSGLLDGLLHPISGLDHLIAMIAVGVWSAQLGSRAVWMLPATFAIVMAIGGALGMLGVPVPGVEIGIAASAVVLGAMVLTAARPPLPLSAVVVAAFALFHGYAHGAEMPAGQNGFAYSVGFMTTTAGLQALGVALGSLHRSASGRRVVRASGACVAAAGIFFLSRLAA